MFGGGGGVVCVFPPSWMCCGVTPSDFVLSAL